MRFSYPQVVLSEIPDEISLSLSISGCPFRCKGCHSQETWNCDFGEELTFDKMDKMIEENKYITCVLFYGGEWNKLDLLEMVKYVKDKGLKVALYSGINYMIEELSNYLDYYKIGEYKEDLGGLESEITNQKIYRKVDFKWERIYLNSIVMV